MSLLRMLDEEKRLEVLQRLPEAQRDQLRERMESELGTGTKTGAAPDDRDIATQRRMIRETAVRVQERVMDRIASENERSLTGGEAAEVDPLDHLREVHPAALAKAMQGERAEAWAMVLTRLEEPSRLAIMSYLDHEARQAIAMAHEHQRNLPEALRRTAERAIRQAVLPRALKEHQMLMVAPYPARAPYVT